MYWSLVGVFCVVFSNVMSAQLPSGILEKKNSDNNETSSLELSEKQLREISLRRLNFDDHFSYKNADIKTESVLNGTITHTEETTEKAKEDKKDRRKRDTRHSKERLEEYVIPQNSSVEISMNREMDKIGALEPVEIASGRRRWHSDARGSGQRESLSLNDDAMSSQTTLNSETLSRNDLFHNEQEIKRRAFTPGDKEENENKIINLNVERFVKRIRNQDNIINKVTTSPKQTENTVQIQDDVGHSVNLLVVEDVKTTTEDIVRRQQEDVQSVAHFRNSKSKEQKLTRHNQNDAKEDYPEMRVNSEIEAESEEIGQQFSVDKIMKYHKQVTKFSTTKKHKETAKESLRMGVKQQSNVRFHKMRHLPNAEQLDMVPAKGETIDSLRIKNRLCQRHVLLPEGPKYNSKGFIYLQKHSNAFRDFAKTPEPRLLLPICCNCCKKSVLGCQ